MIEPIEGAPEGVLAFRAVGKVEDADYESVLTPAIEAAVGEHKKVGSSTSSGQGSTGTRPVPLGRT